LALMEGGTIEAAFEEARRGASVIALETEWNVPTHGGVIALDYIENRTTSRADLVLPAATFAESDGTMVNNEGRAQRFFQVFAPGGEIQESWRWLRDILVAAGRREPGLWPSLDDVIAEMCVRMPALSKVRKAAPAATFRIAGQKVARAPHRYSGR